MLTAFRAGPRVATAGLGLLGGFVCVVIAQHAVEPALEPSRHLISEYANGSAGWLMVAAFLAWAASLALTGALALRSAARAAPRRRAAGVALGALLLVAAAGLVVTAAFPTETSAGELPPGQVLTRSGRLHDQGSGVALLALAAGVPLSLAAIRWPRRVLRVGGLLLAIAAVAGVGLAVAGELPGIRQRVLVSAACVWQAALLVVWRSRCGARA